MLQPKRTKFRKAQKGRNRGLAHRGSQIAFGSFAEGTSNQIDNTDRKQDQSNKNR